MDSQEEVRWQKTDETTSLYHCPNHCNLKLYYGRTYTAGGTYQSSETNQLIFNFKIKPNDPNFSSRIKYKKRAIKTFASEVTQLLAKYLKAEEHYYLVPIPPSKSRSHQEYDDRLEKVTEAIAANFPNVSHFPLLFTKSDSESYHASTKIREPATIYNSLDIDQSLLNQISLNSNISLIIVDDVLTSGAHFMAVRKRLLELFPDSEIRGIFWAKAIQLPMSF